MEDHPHLVEGGDVVSQAGRRNAAVHAEDLVVDDGCDRHHVENLVHLFPHLRGFRSRFKHITTRNRKPMRASIGIIKMESISPFA